MIGIDIGSYKISITSSLINNEEDMEIINSFIGASKGIKEGIIVDENELSHSLGDLLSEAVESLENNNYILDVGISSKNCRIVYDSLKVRIKSGKVQSQDIENIFNSNNKVKLNYDEDIIQKLIVDYKIDNKIVKTNIIGWQCRELTANICYIVGNKELIQGYNRVFNNLGYSVRKFRINIVSNRKLFLEGRLGNNLLVDIGAQTIDMGMFFNYILQELFYLSIGGENITRDISIGLKLPFKESENIKQIFSQTYKKNLLSNDNIIERVGSSKIDKNLLFEIINARIEEILKIIIFELKKQKCYDKIDNIVIFGDGLIYFEDIKELSYNICRKKMLFLSPNQTYLQNSSTNSSLAIVKDMYDDLKLIYKNFTIENILTKESRKQINSNRDVITKFKILLKEIF